MEMTKRVKCESCGGKGMIIPKKHGGMVVPRKCEHCNGTGTTEAPITNADRIRAMSDEELAVLLADEIPHGDCHGCHFNCIYMDKGNFEDSCQNAWYGWLKQPVEDIK